MLRIHGTAATFTLLAALLTALLMFLKRNVCAAMHQVAAAQCLSLKNDARSQMVSYFDSGTIAPHVCFGSSTRGTILPWWMDEHSDMDDMIALSDNTAIPQTYLIEDLRRKALCVLGNVSIQPDGRFRTESHQV